MNRRYTTERLLQLFDYAFALRDDWGFGTDIIVGFPGESEESFGRTLDFLSSAPLSYMHIFPFSSRPGTPATKLPDVVSEQAKLRRISELKQLDTKKRIEFRLRNLGRVHKVLIENRRMGMLMAGHAENYLDVYVTADEAIAGSVVKVRADTLHPEGVTGKIVGEQEI